MTRSGRLCIAAQVVALMTLSLPSSETRADASTPFYLDNWYIPVGLQLGAAVHPQDSNGLLLGGEISALRVFYDNSKAYSFAGLYADANYDFGPDTWRLSIGPEVGYQIFGVDAGLVRQLGSRSFSGGRVRAFAFLVVATVYAGQTVAFGDAAERTFTEVGVLVKLPFCIPSQRHHRCDWGIAFGDR